MPGSDSVLLYNIKGLLQTEEIPRPHKAGDEMAKLPVIDHAWLMIENGLIAGFGGMECFPGLKPGIGSIDCSGRFVMPTYVDSHTHLVFAGSREEEFVLRIKGATYEEIAAAGGGILNSARRLQNTSEDELLESAKARLDEVIRFGTGAIEIKSGYGLTPDAELKMLRVIRRLKDISPIPIKTTFLGAHAYPLEFKQNHQAYLDQIVNEMLPVIAEEGLADYIDVFCDRGFFSPEETAFLLEAGAKYGLKPRLHANELDYSGGIQVGVKHNAVSVDHLEFTGPLEIEALRNSNTIPTLLPSTAFFLKLHYPPAREMIEAGLPVALASDYNPGSSPSGNMNFVLSLACLYLKMTPEEAINAATINSAAALEMVHSHGSIAVGKVGSVIITEPIPSYRFIPYSFGASKVETVILKGKIYS